MTLVYLAKKTKRRVAVLAESDAQLFMLLTRHNTCNEQSGVAPEYVGYEPTLVTAPTRHLDQFYFIVYTPPIIKCVTVDVRPLTDLHSNQKINQLWCAQPLQLQTRLCAQRLQKCTNVVRGWHVSQFNTKIKVWLHLAKIIIVLQAKIAYRLFKKVCKFNMHRRTQPIGIQTQKQITVNVAKIDTNVEQHTTCPRPCTPRPTYRNQKTMVLGTTKWRQLHKKVNQVGSITASFLTVTKPRQQ
eukprot:TRINITY_DN859_c0_g2_i7.p5 TRINITY_DN859_c0_g2~~TRINITY_DN859_c0_g2_i7.p5  ORF type:complete len:242 (+),score=-40.20 TRINITY_DN859_c0_g2_i7:427-1152(+)